MNPDRILANLKMEIELFDTEDIDAGCWAYRLVAESLRSSNQEVIKEPGHED